MILPGLFSPSINYLSSIMVMEIHPRMDFCTKQHRLKSNITLSYQIVSKPALCQCEAIMPHPVKLHPCLPVPVLEGFLGTFISSRK